MKNKLNYQKVSIKFLTLFHSINSKYLCLHFHYNLMHLFLDNSHSTNINIGQMQSSIPKMNDNGVKNMCQEKKTNNMNILQVYIFI